MTEMKRYTVTIFCAPRTQTARLLADVVAAINFVFSHSNWAAIVNVTDYKKGEVIGERKPRIRDRFNPLYYIRKELQKMSDTFTQATDRIEQKIGAINANIEALKTNVANEAAQFKTVVEELRGMSTNENLTAAQSGRLGALADLLDASAANIKAAADGVKGIVPDAPALETPHAVAGLKIVLPTQDLLVAGTPFDIEVVALDAQGEIVHDTQYAGTLHISSSPANVGDVLPGDHLYGTDNHLAVLLAQPGTYVLSVIDAGNPNIVPDQLSVTVS